MTYSFELGPIRPPSESSSLLIRATRNCPWNRCKFCPNYKGEKFQIRSVAEIKQDILSARFIADRITELSSAANTRSGRFWHLNDIDSQSFQHVALWLRGGGSTAFLQDANSLIMKTAGLVEVISFLKQTFPALDRITSYARSETAARKSLEELKELHQAGLSRLHIGLESGYDPILQFIDKGVTTADNIAGGKKVVASGISLCEYVVLGLGGREMGQEHARQTAMVLNEIDPDYIRVRTLAINNRMPLCAEVANGNLIRATDEEIIIQERLMLEDLTCHSHFVSDHITNLLQDMEGKLPEDKEKMLSCIDRFLALPPAEKTNFEVGRRTGIYHTLDDLNNARRHEAAEQAVYQLRNGSKEPDEKIIFALMEAFV